MSNEPELQTPTEPATEPPQTPPATTEPATEPATPPAAPPTTPPNERSLLDPETPSFNMDEVTLDAAKAYFPEGANVNDEQLTGFLDIVNSAESRADLAQKLIEMQVGMIQSAEEQFFSEWENVQTEWRDAAKADKEYGGENFDRSLANALEVIETYARDAKAFKELMTLTGMGNNVELVALLNRVADAIPGEGKPAKGTQAPPEKTQAELLFGGTPQS